MNGTVVPLPSGAEMPPPPVSPTSSWYQFIDAPGTNPPPVWTLGCGFSVAQSNWVGIVLRRSGRKAHDRKRHEPRSDDHDGDRVGHVQREEHMLFDVRPSGDGDGDSVLAVRACSDRDSDAAGGTVANQPSPDETVPYVLGTVPVSTTAGVTTGSVTTQLPPGQIELSAIYNGDSSSLMSAAMFQAFVVQNVAQPTTTITALNSSASPVFGKPVTLTATVTPSQAGGANPTGSVRFGVGGSQFALGEAPVVTVAGVTTATLTTTALPEGSNTVYAVYSGDYNFGASPQVSTTVNEATPAAPTHVNVAGSSTVAAGTTYSATASTDGTGATRYALAASPAAPAGMTIDSAGHVSFHVRRRGWPPSRTRSSRPTRPVARSALRSASP